ncbi:MAG: hypothetical protein QOC66_1449, partial [Pseudonocardiales bacterium]|nr:hypothetical protein [Pseudonocardiales bacterium]
MATRRGSSGASAAPPDSPGTNVHYRVDTIDRFGRPTLRHAGRLHHLGAG